MVIYYILSIVFLFITCAFLFIKYMLEKNKNVNQSLQIEKANNFSIENEVLKSEIIKLKENNIKAYKEGLQEGKNITSFKIQIHPYHEITKNKKVFSNEEIINIGYKYILFVNDIPCLSSHIEILESIKKKEINEDRINAIMSKISEAMMLIPDGNIQIIGSLAEFGKKLMQQKN